MTYSLSIPKPCSENWKNLKPTQKGAFCQSCQKEVIDFTKSTKTDLARKLKQGDNLCGRFRPEQLNTPLPSPSSVQFRRHAALLGFTSLLSLGTPIIAQQTTPTVAEFHQNEIPGCSLTRPEPPQTKSLS